MPNAPIEAHWWVKSCQARISHQISTTSFLLLFFPQHFTVKCDIFVDGSCAHAEPPKFRFAEFAVTRALNSWRSETIRKGPLPGNDHCFLRAEIFAGIMALVCFPNARIHSDSAVFVKVANAMLCAKRDKCMPVIPEAEFDLWIIFAKVLQFSPHPEPEFIKVKAHLDPSKLVGVDEYRARQNGFADTEAKSALNDFPIAYKERRAKIWAEYVHMRDVATRPAFFQLECARVFMQINKPDGEQDCSEIGIEEVRYTSLLGGLFKSDVFPSVRAVVHLEVWNWIQKFDWTDTCRNPAMNDTSWFEIVWRFSKETGCLLAMNPKNKGKRKRHKEVAYFLRSKAGFETLPVAETHQQIRVFQLTVKALEEKVQNELVPRSRVQFSRSDLFVHPVNYCKKCRR